MLKVFLKVIVTFVYFSLILDYQRLMEKSVALFYSLIVYFFFFSVLNGVQQEMFGNHCNRVNYKYHITLVLSFLHWLPVAFRIDFKIVLFVFKSMNGLVPSYLSELLISISESHILHSYNPFNLHCSTGDRRVGFYGQRFQFVKRFSNKY